MRTTKLLLACISLLMLCSIVDAQTNTFPSSGNVGIGTTSPQNILHINSSADGYGYMRITDGLTGSTSTDGMRIGYNSGALRIQNFENSNMSFFVNNSNEALTIQSNGHLGIGTTSPSGILHIHNNVSYANNANEQLILSNGGYRNSESSELATDNAAMSFYMTNYNAGGKHYDRSLDIRVRGAGDGTFGASMIRFFASDYAYASGEKEIMRIHGNGNVGIGVITPTEKLSVEGNIKAKKISVTQTDWPDYVFHPSYELKPLSEVASFIKANKHLPDVPSAKEVEEHGISLGDNQALLLKKIEELTLYIIELKQITEQQQQQINKLQNK